MAEFRLFSRNFIGCCLGSFFYFGAFYLFMPVLPLFVEGLGGMATEIGLAVGIFTLLSVVVRPHSGKFGDRYGLKRFMMLGAGLFALFFLGYFWITDLTVLYVLRVLHGIAHGIFLAAVFAYVGSLPPPNRRGEVMGVFGVANVVAMAIFPAVGTYMVSFLGGFDELFLAAAVMDCVAVAALLAVDEKRIPVKAVQSVSLGSVMRLR
ncbi:MAG: MFS transporter, partial [Selenomonadales bacterium]|nr:MFS transporter [Selenomonadales bacterium]